MLCSPGRRTASKLWFRLFQRQTFISASPLTWPPLELTNCRACHPGVPCVGGVSTGWWRGRALPRLALHSCTHHRMSEFGKVKLILCWALCVPLFVPQGCARTSSRTSLSQSPSCFLWGSPCLLHLSCSSNGEAYSGICWPLPAAFSPSTPFLSHHLLLSSLTPASLFRIPSPLL